VIGAIVRGAREGLFVAELQSPEQAAAVASRFMGRTAGTQLSEGIRTNPKSFAGFGRLRAEQQVAALETQYKEYDAVRFGDLVISINAVRSGELHQEAPNSVYIPVLGTSPVTADLSALAIRHHNVLQAILTDQA